MSATHAIVLIEVERDAMPSFGGSLADLEGVQEAWSVTGDWDFVAVVRVPDADGLRYWTSQVEHGGTLTGVAQAFLGTPENQTKYGAMANADYVDALYVNALGRHADSGGQAYWAGQLDHGTSRADLATLLAQSTEAQSVHLGQIEQGWHLA